MNIKIKIKILVGLFIAMGSLLSATTEENHAVEKSINKATPVTVVKVTQTTMIETTLVRGEIESPNTPQVAAKVAAEIVEIKVDEGESVKTGQLLARLDDEAFRIAERKASADKNRLEALIENQQRRVDRSKQLFKKKLISQSDHDDVSTTMKQLKAELAAGISRLHEASYYLSHTRIVSPVNGIIQQRHISKGDYAKVGNVMFQIVSMDNIRARVYFPDTMGAKIQTGMQVSLTSKKQTVIGTISNMRPMMEEGTRSLHTLVEFDNNNNWKPGTSITAKTVLNERPNAMVVPIKALVRRPAGKVLYQVRGNTVTERIVKTGIIQNNLIEITSGIKAGDKIVLEGASWLTDGATIAIQKGSTK